MEIVNAAIMYYNGEVVEGKTYGNILNLARSLGYSGETIEGFVTSSGSFILPDEAAEIAKRSGTIDESIDYLRPEDLWPKLTI